MKYTLSSNVSIEVDRPLEVNYFQVRIPTFYWGFTIGRPEKKLISGETVYLTLKEAEEAAKGIVDILEKLE